MGNFTARIGAALKAFRHPGAGAQDANSSLIRLLFPTPDDIDWERMAGPRWKAGSVTPFISWARRKFPELSPAVVTSGDNGGDDSGEYDTAHPLARIIRRPNPHYGYSTLISGILLSRIVSGNAYLFKVRQGLGNVTELWYVPHWMVSPRWDASGTRFITHYDYTTTSADGRQQVTRMDPSEVIHIRQGIDPENTRLGLSDLAALYREIGILNEATVYAASILRNFGVPGLMVVPDKDVTISPSGAAAIKERINDTTTGARRGEAIILPEAVKIETLGFSPEQLALDKFLDVPESRIAAALGIPALALGLSSGQDQKTYANMREAREQAIEEWLLPTARDIADDLDFALRKDFALGETERFAFDHRHLRELQADVDARRKSLVLATGRPYLTVNEARAQEGLEPLPGGDELAPAKAPAESGGNAGGGTGGSDNGTTE